MVRKSSEKTKNRRYSKRGDNVCSTKTIVDNVIIINLRAYGGDGLKYKV